LEKIVDDIIFDFETKPRLKDGRGNVMLVADSSVKLSSFEDHSMLQMLKIKNLYSIIESMPEDIRNNADAVAETIENNIRKLIIDEQPTNPKYYDKISTILEDLTKQRKEQVVDYKNYLKEIEVLIKKLIANDQESEDYPLSLKSKAQKSLYDNLGEIKSAYLALKIDKEIMSRKKDNWRGDKIKERELKNIIKQVLAEYKNGIGVEAGIVTIKESKPAYNNLGVLLNKNIDETVKKLFNIVKNQSDYV
jgi:hypothetical protein